VVPIFLTSMGLYDLEVLDQFLGVIEENNINKEICIITTACRDLKHRHHHEVKTREILISVGFSKVDYIDIEFDDPEKLKAYPIICIFGGNPFILLDQIKKTKTDHLLIELRAVGHFIVGHSSGAAILGKTIIHANLLHPEWNDINLREFEAIGLLEDLILPHSNRYSEMQQKLQDIELKENIKFKKIEDGKCLIL
jgi:dipeptidase E